jgi:hypothetical protein
MYQFPYSVPPISGVRSGEMQRISVSEHLRLTKYSMANAIKRGELQVEHLPFLSFLLLLFNGL